MRQRILLGYILGLVIGIMLGCGKVPSTCSVTDLKVNYQDNPLAVEEPVNFSWKMKDATESGQYQTAYRIVVADDIDNLKHRHYIWDSGKIASDCSVAIPYEGELLEPGKTYYWKVSVWDKDDVENTSSKENSFSIGLSQNDWKRADWIGVPATGSGETNTGNYTIQYDFQMKEPAEAGFVWGADRRNYGRHYTCTINTVGDAFELVVSDLENEDILTQQQYDLTQYGMDREIFLTLEHHMTMEIAECSLNVQLDGDTIVDNYQMDNRGSGKSIGFCTARGAYYAYYDNLQILDDNGDVLFRENFEESETIFDPYYVKIENGWLKASSGYILTPGGEQPAPMLRKEFQTEQIVSAKLYASALGIYQIYINGEKINDDYFSPGQSNYAKKVYYRVYDITNYIQAGKNAVGVILGHGRYNRAKADWGDTTAFRGIIALELANGEYKYIESDSSWMGYADGPIRSDDMFQGEFYDASFEIKGWDEAEFDNIGWNPVAVYNDSTATMIAAADEPVRCVEELEPVSVTEPTKGIYVYDFGQNINGICRISVKENKGTVITMRYAETLNTENMSCTDDEIGTIWTQNLYTADNTDYYCTSGEGIESFEPDLVCRGFRYVQITGVTSAIPIENISALVLSSDLDRTGYFECSDADMNQLYESIYWTQKDNFVDIPTDCPQRDERFGWAGDAQTYEPTAAYNANVYQFMRQYVTALRDGQNADGSYPELAPSVSTDGGANGWSDAGIVLTWRLYQQYADSTILYENYDSMCKYVDYLVSTSDNYLREYSGYGDHNAVSTLDDTLCNTAQCAYVVDLLAKISGVLGEQQQQKKYEDIVSNYRQTWQNTYILEDGSIECWLQSAYTLGLAFNLYPQELKEAGAACLNTAVQYNEYHLNTGYIATPYILQTLCKYGYEDTAYQVVQQQTYPSWGYMFAHGATTITEAWNTYYENDDGTFGINGSMNHYGLGSVGAWFYEDVLGIRPDEDNPGYKHFYLEPLTGGGLTYAKGSYESVYGTIYSEWYVEGDNIEYHFIIPDNTTATVTLPDEKHQNMELPSGEYRYTISTVMDR